MPKPSSTGRPARETLKGLPFLLENNPFYLMGHAITALIRNVDQALGATRFSQTQWRTLLALSERSPLSIGEIAEVIMIEGSAVGRAVAKMEATGLVRRETDPADRRIVRVVMTDQGRAHLDALKPIVIAEVNRALGPLSQDEVVQLNKVLKAIRETTDAPHTR